MLLETLTKFLTSVGGTGFCGVSRLLELGVVVEVLEHAFRPLVCKVSVSATKQNVGFVIFDSNGAQIFTAAPRSGLEMRDPYLLRQMIDQVRSQLETEGFRMDRGEQAYLAARSRVMHHITRLAHAGGIAVSVDIDPSRAPFELVVDTHKIQLSYGRHTRVVTVDHETFMNDEFFKTLVLHQIQIAMDDLAASA